MGVMRLGVVETRVMDLEESLRYYTQVVGLQLTGREANRAYLKAWDEEDHHSVVLVESDRPGLEHMAFKVRFQDDLDKFEKSIEQYGIKVNRVSKGARMAEGQAIEFKLPTGHIMQLYNEIEKVGNGLKLNPDPWPDNLKGMAPPNLDHLLLTGDDIHSVTDFMTRVLDFHISEQVVSVDGEQLIGTFLFRTNSPHDIAFIKGPDSKLHHFAFHLDNWNEVLRAADLLTKNDIALDIGPTRHGLTRGTTVYFFDPSGNRNEVFSGGYVPCADFTPITWTEDQLGKAIFYLERQLNERFVTALT